MWTAAEAAKKDVIVSQASLTAILEKSRRERVGKDIGQRDQSDFGSEAWMQSDKSSSAWVKACPKEHIRLNARPFGGAYIFRCGASLFDGIGGAVYSAENRQREERSRDKM
jgi:hypothetical protein